MDELLEDEDAVRTLMTKTAAVDVLAKMSGDELATIINHRYAAKWINYREYAYSTLSGKSEIKALMDASGMYGMYITAESKCRPLVPILTSNTGSDGGEASATNPRTDGSYEPFRAFDNNESTRYEAINNSSTKSLLKYKFVTPTCVNRLHFILGSGRTINVKVVASNDGTTWTTLKTANDYSGNNTVTFENNDYYLYYGLDMTPVSGGNVAVTTLQFYGYQLEGLVPTMTSNTTPSGEAFDGNSSTNAYIAFNGITSDCIAPSSLANAWVGYDFKVPVTINSVSARGWADGGKDTINEFVVEGSKNKTEWTSIYNGKHSTTHQLEQFSFVNDKAYRYIRFRILSNHNGNSAYNISMVQLYGEKLWQPKGLVPVMTSNTAPYGEVILSGVDGTNYGYKAFDGDDATMWYDNGHSNKPYVGYKFAIPTLVKKVLLIGSGCASDMVNFTLTIQGSNNNSDWYDFETIKISHDGVGIISREINIDNNNYYLYYRIVSENDYSKSPMASFVVRELQFYGYQLEALIPAMTSNTSPIGEASADSDVTDDLPYEAFAGSKNFDDTESRWRNAGSGTSHWLQYKFGKVRDIDKIDFTFKTGYADGTHTINVYYLNENGNKVLLQTYTKTGKYVWSYIECSFSTIKATGIRFEFTVPNQNSVVMKGVQAYGAPDYESRTYIYDHGVEVMPLTVDNSNIALGTITKNDDNIRVAMTSTVAANGNPYCQVYSGEIDFNKYNCLCMEMDKELNQGTGSRFFIMAVITSNAPLKAGESKVSELVITKPTNYIDITSIQTKGYAIGFNNGTSAVCTIATWWLE